MVDGERGAHRDPKGDLADASGNSANDDDRIGLCRYMRFVLLGAGQHFGLAGFVVNRLRNHHVVALVCGARLFPI